MTRRILTAVAAALFGLGVALVAVSGTLPIFPLNAQGNKSPQDHSIALRQVARIPIESNKPAGSSIQRIAWSPDGRRLALVLGWGYEIRVLDTESWQEVTRIEWKTFQPERDVAFLSEREIVTGPAENTHNSTMALAVYDSATGRLIREIPRPLGYRGRMANKILVTRDGRFIAAIASNSKPELFDASSGHYLGSPPVPAGTATFAIASGPGSQLAINVVYGLERALAPVRKEIYLVDVSSNTVERILPGHVPGVGSIAWSPNGRWVVSGADMLARTEEGAYIRDLDSIKVWNADTGALFVAFEGLFDPISRIAWHPASDVFATASAKGRGAERGTAVRLWSVSDQRMLFEHMSPDSTLIGGLSFHPLTGQLLWGWDGALYLYALEKANH